MKDNPAEQMDVDMGEEADDEEEKEEKDKPQVPGFVREYLLRQNKLQHTLAEHEIGVAARGDLISNNMKRLHDPLDDPCHISLKKKKKKVVTFMRG
ncbi:unnamed protein product [Caenorhabditis sp. 36 PRJEB53466]|nr:unnamed protein product [Caenorhabditis sp. 36 PRJEB53466]